MSGGGSKAGEGTQRACSEVPENDEARDRLERLATLGTIVAEVTHELNNVLAYVAHNLDVALGHAKQHTRQELLEALESARDGVHQLVALGSNLRGAGAATTQPTLLDVRHVLESAVRMVRPQLERRARLERDYRDVPPIGAVEPELRRALLNLLLNALDAFDADEPERNRIRLSTWTDSAGRAVVEVDDSGRGIPHDLLERIFDPFYTTREGGTGLGLSLCKRVIGRFGGTLAVRSDPGSTAFVVTLPRAPTPAG